MLVVGVLVEVCDRKIKNKMIKAQKVSVSQEQSETKKRKRDVR